MKPKWVQYVLRYSASGVPGGATGAETSTTWGNPRVFHAVGALAQKLKLKRQKESWDCMCRGHLHRTAKDEVGTRWGVLELSTQRYPGRTAKTKLSAGHGM